MTPHRIAFFALYAQSMARLRSYIGRLDAQEARWFQGVLDRFEEEFRNWDRRPFLAGFLGRAEACRFRALGVFAYVYLHIAYDLPRVCAQALRQERSLDWERCAQIFADSGVHIAETSALIQSQTGVLGGFAHVVGALPGGGALAAPLAQWVLAHRCAAWKMAERLASLEDPSAAEIELWTRVETGSRPVFESSNPLVWLRSLPLICSADLQSLTWLP